MKSASISTANNNTSVSYDELVEQIKTVPTDLLGEISQYVGFVLYRNAQKNGSESIAQKFENAKRQTEKYCTKEIAAELAAENYMIGKPAPDIAFDMEQAIADDDADEAAPEDWLKKMFPEVYA